MTPTGGRPSSRGTVALLTGLALAAAAVSLTEGFPGAATQAVRVPARHFAAAADAVGGGAGPGARAGAGRVGTRAGGAGTATRPGAGAGSGQPGRSADGTSAGTARATGRVRPGSGLVARTITVDGVHRHYLIAEPTAARLPAPLVIAFHGLYSTAAGFARQSGLVAAAEAAGEVLILPQSQGAGFNDGRFGPAGPHDDAFAVALMDAYEHSGLVDPERVTVAGFSNGAGMAMQVADAHPDRVAAVVSIDGEMIASAYAPRPTGPVEAVLVHGTADRVQPWLGRVRRGPDLPPYVSAVATVHAWVRADGCTAVRTTTTGAREAGAAGPVTTYRWSPGRTGAGVTFYEVAGLHHRWPVSTAAALHGGDQLAPIGAAQIVVSTAATATREGRRTVLV